MSRTTLVRLCLLVLTVGLLVLHVLDVPTLIWVKLYDVPWNRHTEQWMREQNW